MARPKDRKEWLETFLWLADRNRPAREFRSRLGLKTTVLSKAIKNIVSMRQELKDIYDLEKQKKVLPEKAIPIKSLLKPKVKLKAKLQRKDVGEGHAEKLDDSWRDKSKKQLNKETKDDYGSQG